ncbi:MULTISPECIES: 50S ribosomal protein L32e [unclassified Methanoregula]|uniref:50S ribosomal protein L32e n=1 Tax=unclassified Methanoregula TaxID=2649730 RepID=UPI0009D2CD0F|nr:MULTISPECIES: 50S ribosomal protein L32e [unclassified Methanoregula]OPX62079.1 MAG: 50S ribosomal protein L32e [Methanoregula sp. PtaB.Bin085]OPY36544.1 MAG: 50S ribosomal protein L32e [Methanoregula sp. PtaU1.Bin006]
MATEIKRLIQVRTDKGARFKRDGYGKKRQLSDSWRKPRGQHNKQREQKKAKGALPKPGFGSPVAVRGMHPSGYFEVLVTSLKELEGLDPKTQAVRIGATVGMRKRVAIQDQAITSGLGVLNAKVVKTKAKKPAKAKPKTEEGEEKAEKKATVKKAKAPAKKAAAKPKAEKAEPKAEKKAPAKKAAAKPKAEKKAPAKKAAAKPKAEKAEPKAEKKAPAKKTAAAKAPKKGVKKNE